MITISASPFELVLVVILVLLLFASVYLMGYSAAQSKYTIRQARREAEEARDRAKQYTEGAK